MIHVQISRQKYERFFKIFFLFFSTKLYPNLHICKEWMREFKWNFFRLFYVVWVQFGSILQNYFGAKMLSVSYLSMIICFSFQQHAMSKPYWEVKQSFIWFSIRVCLQNLTIVKKKLITLHLLSKRMYCNAFDGLQNEILFFPCCNFCASNFNISNNCFGRGLTVRSCFDSFSSPTQRLHL